MTGKIPKAYSANDGMTYIGYYENNEFYSCGLISTKKLEGKEKDARKKLFKLYSKWKSEGNNKNNISLDNIAREWIL